MVEIGVQNTLGALEIGVFIALFFFGIVTAQCSIYYQRFPKDPLHIKTLVGFVWFLEVGHTILISCLMYSLIITFYGHPNDLEKYECFNALILFGAGITWTEQAFFSVRIWRIMDRPYLGILCFSLSTIRFLACIVLSALAFRQPSFAVFAEVYGWMVTTVLVGSACVDVIIAVLLCYFLIDQRYNSFGRTTKVLDRLIVWTLQTGLATSVTASVMVICFKTMPKNYIWLAVYMFLGKMYSNSLLASLNNRHKLRDAIGKLCNIPTTGLVRTGLAMPHPLPVTIEMSPTSPGSSLGKVAENI